MEYLFLLVGIMFGFHMHGTGDHSPIEGDQITAETAGAIHNIIVLTNEQLLHG